MELQIFVLVLTTVAGHFSTIHNEEGSSERQRLQHVRPRPGARRVRLLLQTQGRLQAHVDGTGTCHGKNTEPAGTLISAFQDLNMAALNFNGA